MKKVFLLILCVFSVDVFGQQTCESLLRRGRVLSEQEIDQTVQELYDMRKLALNGEKGLSHFANTSSKDILLKLQRDIPKDEVTRRLKLLSLSQETKVAAHNEPVQGSIKRNVFIPVSFKEMSLDYNMIQDLLKYGKVRLSHDLKYLVLDGKIMDANSGKEIYSLKDISGIPYLLKTKNHIVYSTEKGVHKLNLETGAIEQLYKIGFWSRESKIIYTQYLTEDGQFLILFMHQKDYLEKYVQVINLKTKKSYFVKNVFPDIRGYSSLISSDNTKIHILNSYSDATIVKTVELASGKTTEISLEKNIELLGDTQENLIYKAPGFVAFYSYKDQKSIFYNKISRSWISPDNSRLFILKEADLGRYDLSSYLIKSANELQKLNEMYSFNVFDVQFSSVNPNQFVIFQTQKYRDMVLTFTELQ